LSLDGGDPEVHGLAHEALTVDASAEVDLDTGPGPRYGPRTPVRASRLVPARPEAPGRASPPRRR
ncbi:hypothetical protein ABZZ44_34535, partial [Streptomyces sp. NPDC006460]